MWMQRALRVHALESKVREATGLKSKGFEPPLIIGVCGGSGSGKSTFCKQFVHLLGPERVALLKQDDYYRDLSHLPPEERSKVNFDHPDSIEFDLLSEHLDSLVNGLEIAVPKYDFASHCRVHVEQVISPKPIVLVEGILLFSSEIMALKLDLKVFIDTPADVRFDRRLRRDVRERGRTAESVKDQFMGTVMPMHEKFVEPSKTMADRVISGELPFEPHLYDICGHIIMLKQARPRIGL